MRLPARVPQGPIARTGAARGEVCISRTQRNVHVAFEALAVFAAAPFTLYLAQKPGLERWEKAALYTIAGATLVVDGGLLLSYLRKNGATG